jgi:hypothetical protein
LKTSDTGFVLRQREAYRLLGEAPARLVHERAQ